uniref:Palmitoyltransferase n=1 Tax=Acrobeloides nanus TaxID=290746 RepID=A0A914CN94_9BILA
MFKGNIMKFDVKKLYVGANYLGVVYTILVTIGVAIINLWHTCPAVYGSEECTIVYFWAVLILSEVTANLILFQYYRNRNQISYWTVKSSTLLIEESEKLSKFGVPIEHIPISESTDGEYYRVNPGGVAGALPYHDPRLYPSVRNTNTTKFCYDCNIITPRRCHHCCLCNMCVLRKDHHCFLTGGCVGLANQRYFIVFLFWASFGAFYGCWYNFWYLNEFVNPWYPFGWMTYIGPVALFRWALGYSSLFNMFLAVLFSISFASGFGALAFFIAQMFYTLYGYTMHDYHVGRLRDHLESDGENMSERLALVFGRRWYLNFFVPQFWVPNQMTPGIARNIFLSISKDL